MKKCLLTLVLISLFSLGLSSQQLIGDQLLNLSGRASEETEEVQRIVRELFNNIQLAIDETNQITEELSEYHQSGTNIPLEVKQNLKERIETIHNVYRSINSGKEHYQRVLEMSGSDAAMIKGNTDRLLESETQKLKDLRSEVDHLERKGKLSTDEENQLRAARTKQKLREIIVETLNDFATEMNNFSDYHTESQNKIIDFFSQVRYSSEVTELMIEVVDLSIKAETILENIESLNEIQKYTKEMYESLDILSRSLESLKNLANRNQT